MLRSILIFLLAVLIAFGSTFYLYQEEIVGMIGMIQNGGTEEKPDDPSKPDDGVKAVSIALDISAAKTVFDFGEEFTTEGLKITVTMSDGSTKEVAPGDCNIKAPDTTKAGTRPVLVAYGGVSERYEVTVNAKIYPTISSSSLVDITEENDSVPYRVEAELIDMVTPGVKKAEGFDSFVAVAPEGAAITSGEQYLTGFGVKWNYFGFTFTAAEKYENVTLVLRVANATDKNIDAGAVKMYLNMTQDEQGTATGNIPLDGYIINADGACGWSDIVIRNLTILEGTNTLTFEVQKDQVFDIDYVDFYVGMRYINSVVEIKDNTTIVKDLEALDTEKAFTRDDVANAHGLKPGQLFVEPTKESPGKTTSGGTAVGAIGNGSQMSTTIRLSQDATVLIKFKASAVGKGAYYVKDNWNFYIDGVKLTTVEAINIEGGDSGKGLWWDWIYTNVGIINLSAGDHFFLLEVHGVDCNVDTVEFEIVSFGSFDESGSNIEDMVEICKNVCPICGKCLDANCAEHADKCQGHANEDFEMIIEAETFDNEGVVTRQDMIDAGRIPAGEYMSETGNGATCICGFTSGTYFKFNVTLEEAKYIEMFLVGATDSQGYDVSAKLSLKVNGEDVAIPSGSLSGSGATPYWDWQTVSLGKLNLNAGDNEIVLTIVDGHPNLDKVMFSEVEQFKLEVEAETFDNEGVVTRQDMIDAGRIPAGEYMSETGNGATCICGFTSGTYFKFNVTLEEAKYIEMFLVGATDSQGYDVSAKLSLKVNGEDVAIPSGSLSGSGATPYWDWQTVSLGKLNLNAGDNEIVLTIVDGHPNLDKVMFIEVLDAPVAPPHECESICPECGKCLDAECGESACTDKCQGHAPVVVTPDITITDANDKYKVEAEELDMSTLTPQPGFAKPVIESFDGGKGLGGIGAGGYQSFVVTTEKDVKVNLCISFANANGGSILNFIPQITVNGEALTLLDGQIPAGIGTPQESVSKFYWNVADVHIATLNLVAGETYTIKISVNQGNLDGYTLIVVKDEPIVTPHACESICPECGKCLDAECGESACADKCQGHAPVEIIPDVTVATSGSTRLELEALDLKNSTIVLRGDLINAGFTAPGNSDGRIWGMADGTTIRLYVKVEEACNLKISLGGFGTAMSSFTYKFGDTTLSAEGNYGSGSTAAGVIGTVEISEAGIYLFEFTTGGGVDLDYLLFEVVNITPAHECESICTACGKCTDGECAEDACATKCEGHHIDANISASDVAVNLEAENWYYNDDSIVTRSDFIPSIGAGNLKSESGNGAVCIFAFTAGTKFVINVNADSDMVVDLLLRGATDAQGYDVASNIAVTLNGQTVSGAYGSLTGSGDKPYWDWQTTSLGRLNLVKGVNEITITILASHPNIDLIRLVPVKADVTVAESGSTVLHMENFDEHKSSIDSKDDFVNAYAGNGFKEGDVFKNPGLGRIYGFNPSTFVMHVEVKEACTLKISVNLWNCNPLNTYKYYFGGQAINCTNETAPSGAGTYEIGSVTVSEAGIYTFVFTTGGVDFDEVIFTVE